MIIPCSGRSRLGKNTRFSVLSCLLSNCPALFPPAVRDTSPGTTGHLWQGSPLLMPWPRLERSRGGVEERVEMPRRLWYTIGSSRTHAAGYRATRRFGNKTPAVDVAPWQKPAGQILRRIRGANVRMDLQLWYSEAEGRPAGRAARPMDGRDTQWAQRS